MKKIFLVSIIVLLASNLLVWADEQNKLPNYKKWEVFKYESISLYRTHISGCRNLDLDELSKEGEEFTEKQFPFLTVYQYRSLVSDDHDFLDLIKDNYNQRELIFYGYDLFERKRRFLFFGYKWQYSDTFPKEEDGKYEEWVDKIVAFQLKHCLFFPTH